MGGRVWTPTELVILHTEYGKANSRELASKLGRSVPAIIGKAYSECLKKANKWTPNDDGILRREYEHTDLNVLSTKLGRSILGVRQRAHKLKLRRHGTIGRICSSTKWKASDDDIIRNEYPTADLHELSIKLNRTLTSVMCRARLVGVTRDRYINRICRLCNQSHPKECFDSRVYTNATNATDSYIIYSKVCNVCKSSDRVPSLLVGSKFIEGYDKKYSINIDGTVRSHWIYGTDGKKLRAYTDNILNVGDTGLMRIVLLRNPTTMVVEIRSMFKLMCVEFNITPPDDHHKYMHIHLDGDPSNFSVSNIGFKQVLIKNDNYNYSPKIYYDTDGTIIEKRCLTCGDVHSICMFKKLPSKRGSCYYSYRNICKVCAASFAKPKNMAYRKGTSNGHFANVAKKLGFKYSAKTLPESLKQLLIVRRDLIAYIDEHS